MPCPDAAACSCCVILTDSLGELHCECWGSNLALELWVTNWWQRLTRGVCVCGSVESCRLCEVQQSLLLRPVELTPWLSAFTLAY
jgi:hypothetical protein